jgi:glycosyltransferase involved in cell wall biosynthesis
MPVVYRLCDVFILPSKGPVETWGLSINEAMACSKAVLVSRVCGCAIDLIHEDVNGYVFNSDNKKYLVEKMKVMLRNKNRLKEMGNESFKIIQNWSFEKICEKIEQLVMMESKYKINITEE